MVGPGRLDFADQIPVAQQAHETANGLRRPIEPHGMTVPSLRGVDWGMPDDS